MTPDARQITEEVWYLTPKEGVMNQDAAHEIAEQWKALNTGKRLIVFRAPIDIGPLASLDAAWRAAEEALPEGYSMGGLIQRARDGSRWQGVAMRLSEVEGFPNAATIEGESAATPAAALLALAEALRERP